MLAEGLATATPTPGNCWFLFWEDYGWNCLPAPGDAQPRWRAPNQDYLLFHGEVTAANGFQYGPWKEAPTIWWPDDHARCVATEIDGYRTYIAANAKTVDALLASSRLEIMPVSIDQDADTSPYTRGRERASHHRSPSRCPPPARRSSLWPPPR